MVENSLYQTTATAAAVDVLGYSCRHGTSHACSASCLSVWRRRAHAYSANSLRLAALHKQAHGCFCSKQPA